MERKQDIFNFSSKTRLLTTRLLALVKWASSAAKVDKSVVSFCDKVKIQSKQPFRIFSRIKSNIVASSLAHHVISGKAIHAIY
jgi:hypothetical protein